MPHTLAERWLERLNPNVKSLQPFYGVGKYRMQSYEEMIEAMMVEVRKGKKVCGAFYGHAGVFACVPRLTIDKAREEGFRALMEPGISAEACLYADRRNWLCAGRCYSATGCCHRFEQRYQLLRALPPISRFLFQTPHHQRVERLRHGRPVPRQRVRLIRYVRRHHRLRIWPVKDQST